jgi:1-acyl-sn-glycerol-3-phosphate acyltransferase
MAAETSERDHPDERAAGDDDLSSYANALRTAKTLLTPWTWMTAPYFAGLDEIPDDRPLLFVGNHTLFGMLDVPLMLIALYEERGILVHPLGDHLHFGLPVWRDLVTQFGVIEGTRENCREAMQEGKSLLVYPGGGREVTKRRSERNQLVWGERLGFARLALECDYTIVPFASVGADDCWDILVDGDDLLSSPLAGLIERFHPRPDLLPPLVRGVGGSMVPRPERFYFRFGEAIEAGAGGRCEQGPTDAACAALRDEVQRSIEASIAALLAYREQDPKRAFSARWLRGA